MCDGIAVSRCGDGGAAGGHLPILLKLGSAGIGHKIALGSQQDS
jgi:hypothetical protein